MESIDKMGNMEHSDIMGILEWSILINENLWFPRDFDVLIIELLQYALQGKVSKILLGVPSRHGKSTLISQNFCSYFLAHFPNEQVILSSYSQLLASEFGGKVKNIINQYGKYSPYPNITISVDSKAKNKFTLSPPYHGRMLSVSSGGAILGFGAGLFIVDDPIKNVADAESQTLQEKLKNWFHGTAKTRLQKRTNGLPPIMIIIAQRLHLKDLHGIVKETEPTIEVVEAFEILRNGGSIPEEVWVNFNLPAICENEKEDLLGRKKGEVLWPEQRDYEWLMAEKKAMGSYLFNAIYQGNPSSRDGEIFKRKWFYDENNQPTCIITPDVVPYNLPKIRYWDFASGIIGDESSGVLTGYDGNYLYILDLINGNYSPNQTIKLFKRTSLHDGKSVKIYIEEEPGSGSRLLIDSFKHDPELRGYNIHSDRVHTAKNIRSFDLETLAEEKLIKIVEAPWNNKMIEQLISFTGADGNRDDIVDSLTGAARAWFHRKTKIII